MFAPVPAVIVRTHLVVGLPGFFFDPLLIHCSLIIPPIKLSMSSLTFLGTGGGRFVTLSQVRNTAGLWLEADGKNIMIDPATGTLIRSLQYGRDLRDLDAIFVSHPHLDHYGEAEVCIEGMTDAMNSRRGTLLINKNSERYVSDYHRDMTNVLVFDSPKKHIVEGIAVETIPTFDHDGDFGFKFHLKDGIITYASDSNYNKSLSKHYKGSDILILNVLRPDENKIFKHLSLGEAEQLIMESQPKKAILTHFGYYLATADMRKESKRISAANGVETIAAEDGMIIKL
jgi:ribonuclease BN (tRNA processing enzyme)